MLEYGLCPKSLRSTPLNPRFPKPGPQVISCQAATRVCCTKEIPHPNCTGSSSSSVRHLSGSVSFGVLQGDFRFLNLGLLELASCF